MNFFNSIVAEISSEKIVGALWALSIGIIAFIYRSFRERTTKKELLYETNLDIASRSMDILMQTETALTRLILDLENGEDQSDTITSLINILTPMAESASQEFSFVERIYKELYRQSGTGRFKRLKSQNKILKHTLRVSEISLTSLLARQTEMIAILTTRSELLSEQKSLKLENENLNLRLNELIEINDLDVKSAKHKKPSSPISGEI
jgi:hypothetical protein